MEQPQQEERKMRRRKRNTILRIALGLAIAAIVPATALAKPVNQDVEDHGQYQLGPGEIPYVSQDRQAMELGLSEGKIKALGLLPKQDVEDHGQYQLGPGEIPYVSQDRQAMELGLSEGKIKALGLLDDGTVGASSDDRAFSRATPIPHGVQVASAATSPDDRSFSRATSVDPTPVVVSDDGRSIDIDPYTVTGFVLALLLAMGIGMGISIWHNRRTKLSPA